MWKVCSEPFKNVELIFPTQQKDVYNFIELNKEHCKKIVIFGSSVTSLCNPWSDIDVYVELLTETKIRKPKCDILFDVWDSTQVDDRLLAEIERTGVIVYER